MNIENTQKGNVNSEMQSHSIQLETISKPSQMIDQQLEQSQSGEKLQKQKKSEHHHFSQKIPTYYGQKCSNWNLKNRKSSSQSQIFNNKSSFQNDSRQGQGKQVDEFDEQSQYLIEDKIAKHKQNLNQTVYIVQNQQQNFQRPNKLKKKVIINQKIINEGKKLSYFELGKQIKRRYLRKQNIWSQRQNLKYVAFLQVHKQDFICKKKYLLNQFYQYSPQISLKKLRLKHFLCFENKRGKSIQQIIDTCKKMFKVTDHQIEIEKRKIIQFQAEKQRIRAAKYLQDSKLNQFLSKYPSEKLSNIQIKLGQFSSAVNYNGGTIQVIPIQNDEKEIKNDETKKKKKFLVVLSLGFQMDLTKFSCISNLNNQKMQQDSNQVQEVQKSGNQLQAFLVRLYFENKLKEQDVLDKIQRVNKNFLDNTLNHHKKQREKHNDKKQHKNWTPQEDRRLLVFLTVFQQFFESFADITSQHFKVMSEFVKTRTYVECMNHIVHFRQKYSSINEYRIALIKCLNINPDSLQKEIRHQIQKCKNPLNLIDLQKRNYSFEVKSEDQQIIKKRIKKKVSRFLLKLF